MPRFPLLVGLTSALILSGCAGSAPHSEWQPVSSATATLGVSWTPLDSLNERLPETVRVVQGVSASAPLRAWAAHILPGIPLRVLVSADTSDGREKPTEFAARTGACVVLNGGYFNMTTGAPVGLVALDGAIVSRSVDTFERDSISYVAMRGAVGILPDGGLDLLWALDDGSRPCGWDTPISNRPGEPGDSPAACSAWPVRDALGAGPMIARGGVVSVTADEEVFFGTSIPQTHPRSAVGRAADGSTILLVVDGRQDASRGVTLEELAALMLDLGAVDALNLDGGGSSAMVVDGVRVNLPTGHDVQREVSNALGVFCGRSG